MTQQIPAQLTLTEEQISKIRSIVATKAGTINKRNIYALEALSNLLSGKKLSPLHIGRPMNATYKGAIEIAETLGVKATRFGSEEDWITMKNREFHYLCEAQNFNVLDILSACAISYSQNDLRGIRL